MPIEYITDKKGELQAVLEFWIVNEEGFIDDKGSLVFVNDFYVNPNERNNGMIPRLVWKVLCKVPWAKAGYYKRRKYNDRIKIIPRVKWLRLVKKYRDKEAKNEMAMV